MSDEDIDALCKRLHKVSRPGHSCDVKRICWQGLHFGVSMDVVKKDLEAYVKQCETKYNKTDKEE